MQDKDLTVIWNQEDAMSVDPIVRELLQEPYNPVFVKMTTHVQPYPIKESFLLAVQT